MTNLMHEFFKYIYYNPLHVRVSSVHRTVT